ncbi:protein-glutamate O-methyltransferase CheR [Paraglaciecola sp.]|uniref:CheR family methyltransferase n=1 Tax=Paraglaciecola sp. TaxID=1920173 RepID=UPI0030F3BB5B
MSKSNSDSFTDIQTWLYQITGIHLNDGKISLVNSRLQKRMHELQVLELYEYVDIIKSSTQEQQVAVNLLTTNETYFFREQQHFDFLLEKILPECKANEETCIWSAAASSGEESYTIALLAASALGLQRKWSIFGTDVNTDVLRLAKRAVYPIQAAEKIPLPLRKQYCEKGKGNDIGWFRIKPEIRQRVSLKQHNLMHSLQTQNKFHLVFLRNVLIYFEIEDKQRIVQNILQQMHPGAWLLVGHSESITGYDPRIKQIKTACYQYLP